MKLPVVEPFFGNFHGIDLQLHRNFSTTNTLLETSWNFRVVTIEFAQNNSKRLPQYCWNIKL